MFTRKSQTTESVLSHPMLWLDERIFGWSRSASIGQSIWDGSGRDRARSVPSTAPASPVESDDEEEEADVDYDDVLAIIDTRKGEYGMDASDEMDGGVMGSPRGKRKGGKSYQDLANLRESKAAAGGLGGKSPTLGEGGTTIPLPSVDDEGPKLTLRKGEKK